MTNIMRLFQLLYINYFRIYCNDIYGTPSHMGNQKMGKNGKIDKTPSQVRGLWLGTSTVLANGEADQLVIAPKEF